MFELAHFYGWTLDYIRTIPVKELTVARNVMQAARKNEGGGNGK